MTLVGAALTACSNHDFDVMTPGEIAQAKYEAAFVQRFGQPDANHTWGFGETTRSGMTRVCIKPDMPEYKNYEDAPAIDANEFTNVQPAFQNIPDNYVSENIPLTTFFVQHIGASHRKYLDGYNTEVDGSGNMNTFKVWKDENVSDGTHALDFNQSTTGSTSTRLYVDEGTAKFSYHNSTDSKDHFEYIVKKIGDYYYVGFSFKATGDNPNQQVTGDNNFDDWIVRISPAKLKGDIRVIAEDLTVAENGDFDFNDVVFDIILSDPANNGNTTIILQAAGGTLPLYVAGKEVHEAFGVGTNVMVNTKAANGVTKEPVTIRLDMKYDKAIDVPVMVKKSSDEMLNELIAGKGKVPSKIGVPVSYEWCDEREDIATKYPKFTDYVNNEQANKDWYIK